MNDLLKEAIADAKAVRETAMKNAKIALTEAFAPKLQSMLSAKLAQEAEEGNYDDDMEETKYIDDGEDGLPADGMEEAEKDDEEVVEMSDEEEIEEEGEEPEEVEEEGLDLEAIIRELEAELAGSRIAEKEEEEGDEDELEEAHGSSGIGKSDNAKSAADKASTDDPGKGKLKEAEGAEKEEDEVNEIEAYLNELIAEMEGEDEKEKDEKSVEEIQTELAEAYTVIQFLRDKINEVSLMNSKLLFSTRIFKDFDLSPAQKEKVLENFDRAMNVRETKLIYATLCENMTAKKKTKPKLAESIASRSIKGTAPSKDLINENRQFVAKFQRLANITKTK